MERKLGDQKIKSKIILSLIYGLLISVCLVWGYHLNRKGTIFWDGFFSVFIYVLVFACVSVGCYGLIWWLDCGKNKVEQAAKPQNKKALLLRMLLYAASVFILWMPSFLVVYPGWFNYDAPWQLSMYISNEISSHHPVLHTLLLGGIIEKTHQYRVAHGDWAYNYNISIALYCLVQMFLSALGLGYVAAKIGEFTGAAEKKGQRLFTILTIIFFGLYPPIVLLVMSPTKDILFGICFLVFLLQTYELIVSGKNRSWAWGIMMALCVILRQNSLYVFLIIALPLILFLALKFGKKSIFSILPGVLLTMALYILYTGPLYQALQVTEGSKAEFLSVPCQQVVKVYLEHGSELEEEQRAFIESLFEESGFTQYRPKLADATKGALNMDLFENKKKEFLSLYINLAKEYPKDYWDAFVILNYGFWYPDAVLDLYEDGSSLFFASDYVLPAQSNSKLPLLFPFYESFRSGFPVQGGGVLTWLLMPALSAYLLLFTFFYMMYKKQAGGIFVCVIGLLVWLTFLLGPCVSIRYIFYLYLMIPLNLWMLSRGRVCN